MLAIGHGGSGENVLLNTKRPDHKDKRKRQQPPSGEIGDQEFDEEPSSQKRRRSGRVTQAAARRERGLRKLDESRITIAQARSGHKSPKAKAKINATKRSLPVDELTTTSDKIGGPDGDFDAAFGMSSARGRGN